MTLNKEDTVKMLYSVEVRWGLWGCGAVEHSLCVEIRWGPWGCGAELMCGDKLGAVGLRSRADVWRYVVGCGAAEQS